MKRFRIPLIDKCFRIYKGPKEWEKYRKDIKEAGAEVKEGMECPEKGGGKAWGGWIWVYSLKDTNTLMHEISHFIDDLMLSLGSDDSEFRAYITGWVIEEALKWRRK